MARRLFTVDSEKEVLHDCYMVGDGETENRVIPGTIWLLAGVALTVTILLTAAFGGSDPSSCDTFCISIPNWILLAIVLVPVIAVVSLVGLIRARRAYLSNIEHASDWDAAVVFFLWLQVIWSGLITLAGLSFILA